MGLLTDSKNIQYDNMSLKEFLDLLSSEVDKFDLPIGFEYTQRAGRPTPSEMGFVGIWENVSSEYAGLFDRIEGGNALAFGAGVQTDRFQGFDIAVKTRNTSVIFTDAIAGANDGPTGSSLGGVIASFISDGTNGTPRTGIETNPVNMTVRIWRGTA